MLSITILRIDTNSWHYKLNSKMYGTQVPKSLCPYFWSTILSITILSWLSALVELIERQNISMPSFNIGLFNFLGKHSMLVRQAINIGLAGYGGIVFFGFNQPGGIIPLTVGISLSIFALFSDRIFSYKFTPKVNYEIKEKNPSILVEMIKAKHHRICPRLDFVDIEKEEFNDKVRMIDAVSKVRENLDSLEKNWDKPHEMQNKRLSTQNKEAKSS